jgi:hypothetical protein
MKTAVKLLKFTAWLLIFMGGFHLYTHGSGIQKLAAAPDEATKSMVAALTSYTVHDWPAPRTALDLYQGLGLSYFACPIFIGALLLFILPVVGEDQRAVKRLSRCMTTGIAALMVISLTWLTMVPTLFLAASLILSIVAVLASRGKAAA